MNNNVLYNLIEHFMRIVCSLLDGGIDASLTLIRYIDFRVRLDIQKEFIYRIPLVVAYCNFSILLYSTIFQNNYRSFSDS